MVMGRPPEYDREAIAEALVEWAKKDDSLNLNGFCTTHDPLIPPSYISIWAKESKEFSRAYETAKSFLGVRREQKLKSNELHVKAYDLNAATYDYFLKEEKRAEKEHEASLKSKDDNGDALKQRESIESLSLSIALQASAIKAQIAQNAAK